MEPPKAKITLQYVHGYRTKDCRQNLFFVENDTLIFHAAAVLVEHNFENNTQILHTDHNDDILSIDYHRKTGRVVTGELGPKPLINCYENGKLTCEIKAP